MWEEKKFHSSPSCSPSAWVMEEYYLPEQIVCNAWMEKGYAWFTDGEEVEDGDGGMQIGGNDVFLR